jgi:hypothetical protein
LAYGLRHLECLLVQVHQAIRKFFLFSYISDFQFREARSWNEQEICLSNVWKNVRQNMPKVSFISTLLNNSISRYLLVVCKAGRGLWFGSTRNGNLQSGL